MTSLWIQLNELDPFKDFDSNVNKNSFWLRNPEKPFANP